MSAQPDVLLKGGRLIDPSSKLDGLGDLLVRNGKIEGVGGTIAAPDGATVIDCSGQVVSPGFIDVHCHLREPGREDVETIATGARAAAARVYPIGAISIGERGERLAEFGEKVGAGAIAVSDDGKPVVSAQLMRTALEYARTFGIPVADHCEDPTLADGGAMNEGLVSARLGLKGIPSEAEEIMVIRDILLARRTGGHAHICHVSTKGSVELLRWGKDRGIRVTAEVCPHHLSLTEAAVEGYNTNAKMNPPLRTADDVEAMQVALRDGTIDLVATDHAPHHYDEKEREFADAPNGIVGLETALAVVVTTLCERGILSYAELVERMAVRPARVFNLPGGTLARGTPADVTVFDPTHEWVVDPSTFLSKGRNTPYAGRRLRGRAVTTIVGGRVVFRVGD